MLVLNGTVDYDENRFVRIASNVAGRRRSESISEPRSLRRPVIGSRARSSGTPGRISCESLGPARGGARLRAGEDARRGEGHQPGRVPGAGGRLPCEEGRGGGGGAGAAPLGDGDEEIARCGAAIESNGELALGPSPRLALRAPFDGRVLDRKVTPGSPVEAMQPLLRWQISGRSGSSSRPTRRTWRFCARASRDAFGPRPIRRRRSRGASTSWAASSTRRRAPWVRATVENPAEKLRPGMFVKAQVDVPSPRRRPSRSWPSPRRRFRRSRAGRRLRRDGPDGSFDASSRPATPSRVSPRSSPGSSPATVVTEGSFVLKSEFAKAVLAEED